HPDAARHGSRNVVLHVARTGSGATGRCSERPVLIRRRPVRNGDGETGVPGAVRLDGPARNTGARSGVVPDRAEVAPTGSAAAIPARVRGPGGLAGAAVAAPPH